MLDLDSPDWAAIPASCGMSSALAVTLLRRARDGDDAVYAELYHQVCHQFTVGAVAYLAIPHLVEIARLRPTARRVWPLSIVGTVAAARRAYHASAAPLRPEWRAEYLRANEEALRLTADALSATGWGHAESQQLIATLAALQGQVDLAMHLFLAGGDSKLSCPVCGEYIEFGDDGGVAEPLYGL